MLRHILSQMSQIKLLIKTDRQHETKAVYMHSTSIMQKTPRNSVQSFKMWTLYQSPQYKETGALKLQVLENASTEKWSTKRQNVYGWKIQVWKIQVRLRKDGTCKYGKLKYEWVGLENASTEKSSME